MASATSASPMANSVFVVTPPNNYPMISGIISQVPLNQNNQPPVHLAPGIPPALVSHVNALSAQKVFKEGKVLGAIQILIGLAHLGLGSIMAMMPLRPSMSVSFYGGFPFWGGIWFIISGSFSVVAENQPNHSCLLNASVGLSIFSAICSAVGIILSITDLSRIRTYASFSNYPPYSILSMNPRMAVSGVLLVFCLLEFCVTCTYSHFGCQLACYQQRNVEIVMPNVYTTNPEIIPEPPNSTPIYSEVGQDSK